MGNHLATRRAAEPRASLDQSPHGRPNNSYWRKRRAEDTWKLREALLDGRVEAVCVWLGIDAHKHADLLGNEATTSRSRDRDPEPPRSSSGERVGCSQVCSCLYGNAESPTDDANGNAVHSLPPITANNTAASEDMATCAPRWSCLGSLDLSSHRWEDDGGHSALHYLAGGRTETSYMSTNFPVIGQDASPGSKPDHESSRHRLALMLILLREGYITRDAVIMTNGSGATPVHVAAAVGNQMFVIAMLRKRASSAPTFSASAVDTALLTADADGLVPVDAAAKFGHAGGHRQRQRQRQRQRHRPRMLLRSIPNCHAHACRCGALSWARAAVEYRRRDCPQSGHPLPELPVLTRTSTSRAPWPSPRRQRTTFFSRGSRAGLPAGQSGELTGRGTVGWARQTCSQGGRLLQRCGGERESTKGVGDKGAGPVGVKGGGGGGTEILWCADVFALVHTHSDSEGSRELV